jgi:hypothetical protein
VPSGLKIKSLSFWMKMNNDRKKPGSADYSDGLHNKKMRKRTIGLFGVLLICIPFSVGHAQSYTSANATWSSSWGFASPADRQIALQRAQTMYQMRNGNPQSVVNNNTYNNVSTDNRQNYVEQSGEGQIEFVGADKIGQNTNSIGAMNTGSTSIDINGSNNTVTATNSSDSNGCVDGSIQTSTANPSFTRQDGQIDISVLARTSALSCR